MNSVKLGNMLVIGQLSFNTGQTQFFSLLTVRPHAGLMTNKGADSLRDKRHA